jgi:membrane-associated protease RseP (regulator of RpoE activity)
VPHRRFQHRWWLHILLFLMTVGSTTLLGILNYVAFNADSELQQIAPGGSPGFLSVGWALIKAFYLRGLAYSAAVLGILGAHEMGHYVACVYHDVDATLPYFLPSPFLTGTFGAVIRIRERFPNRKALFDIGVAGPIAGFVVLVPVLVLGLHISKIVPIPKPSPDIELLNFGEPLVYKAVRWLTLGPLPAGYDVNWHPVAFAAWFGMLATAFNLLPFGQFDGGHLTYALVGTRARYLSMATLFAAIGMCAISSNWVVLALVMLAMVYFVGLRHPPVLSEHESLGAGRYVVAIVVIAIFVLCFMPIPVQVIK